MRLPKDVESILQRCEDRENEIKKIINTLTIEEICQLANKWQLRLKPRDRRTRRVNKVDLARCELRCRMRNYLPLLPP